MLYVIMISNRVRLTVSRIVTSKHNAYIYTNYIYDTVYDFTIIQRTKYKLAERENPADRQQTRNASNTLFREMHTLKDNRVSELFA